MLKYSWGIALLTLSCSNGYGESGATAVGPTGTAGAPGVPLNDGPISFSQPTLPGEVHSAAHAPRPMSGGTLLVMKGDERALVADPDHDQLLLVNLTKVAIEHSVALDPGSEPGRAADDAQGHVHVALRGSGKLLTLDAASGEVLATRDVCAYPRGVAVSNSEQLVHVACAEGSLLTLSTDPSQAAPVRRLELDRDLRDIVVASDGLWVSRFKSAEILKLDSDGHVKKRTLLPSLQSSFGQSESSVAWRMTASPSGGVVVVHQRAFTGEVVPSPGGYGGSGVPGGIVSSAVTRVDEDGSAQGSAVALSAPLPVDVAVSRTSGEVLLASAALEHPLQPATFGRTLLLRPSELAFGATPFADESGSLASALDELQRGQLVAVAFAGDQPVLQYREPSRLLVGGRSLTLPGESVGDTGDQLFHLETGSGLACASCHPEGQEDGHVWHFSGFGARRTQSLRGGLLGSEPFHWDGQEQDFVALTTDVMQGRMAGPSLTDAQTSALAQYVDRFPGLPAPAREKTDAVARGEQLFNDAAVGCTTCHSGARLSNDQTVFVGGDDGPLQVPSLVGIWSRAPYLHDGCAPTLLDRFSTRCDSGQHGNLQGLSTEDLSAMVAYLDTL